jgi:hypothetical protein
MNPFSNQKIVMPRPVRGENDEAILAQSRNNFSLGIKEPADPKYGNENVMPNAIIQGSSFDQADNQSGGPTNPDSIPTTGNFERKYSSTLEPQRDPQKFQIEDEATAPQLAQHHLANRLAAIKNGDIHNYNNHSEVYR